MATAAVERSSSRPKFVVRITPNFEACVQMDGLQPLAYFYKTFQEGVQHFKANIVELQHFHKEIEHILETVQAHSSGGLHLDVKNFTIKTSHGDIDLCKEDVQMLPLKLTTVLRHLTTLENYVPFFSQFYTAIVEDLKETASIYCVPAFEEVQVFWLHYRSNDFITQMVRRFKPVWNHENALGLEKTLTSCLWQKKILKELYEFF